jgi:zinc-binding in reverse transcriptase/Reverse transcriptase-like
MLEEKFHAHLAGWKTNVLSPAGRLTLLKSSLSSIPVYYMSCCHLPVHTINKVTSLLRKFFWGKLDRKRYLAFIAWDKICLPYEEGGLNVKDLRRMNDAILLKLVWQIASRQERLWVGIMVAKYCQNSDFWQAGSMSAVSPLWRHIQKIKDHLRDHVWWSIASGTRIPALSQPWHDDWQQLLETPNEYKEVMIADLVSHGQWDCNKMVQIFGTDQTDRIIQSVQLPTESSLRRDRLIYKLQTSGNYTVKAGYRMLSRRMQGQSQPEDEIWAFVWGLKGLLPRVQLFLWKACRDGLATALAMHRRIASVNPKCARCGNENEFLTHMFFFCQSSRAVWFGSRLSLRIESIPINFIPTLHTIMEGRSPEEHNYIANLLWCLWKARNAEVFEGSKINPYKVCLQAGGMNTEIVKPPNQQKPKTNTYYTHYSQDIILVDASWDVSHRAGMGALLYDHRGKLLTIHCCQYSGGDVMHAETMAVSMALDHFIARGPQRGCVLFTDCQNLVQEIQNAGDSDSTSWKAEEEILRLRQLLNANAGKLEVRYAHRDHLIAAHNLANLARRKGYTYQGVPTKVFLTENNITEEIDRLVFRVVQDDGG